jgi:hypothetical protein
MQRFQISIQKKISSLVIAIALLQFLLIGCDLSKGFATLTSDASSLSSTQTGSSQSLAEAAPLGANAQPGQVVHLDLSQLTLDAPSSNSSGDVQAFNSKSVLALSANSAPSLLFSVVRAPLGGRLIGISPYFVYIPNSGFQGSELITFGISSDGNPQDITAFKSIILGVGASVPQAASNPAPLAAIPAAFPAGIVDPSTAAPTALSYPQAKITLYQGVANSALLPVNSGGAIASYQITPALPAGLVLNAKIGSLSGIASQLSSLQNYVVTGTNSSGSTTASISIEVLAAAAPRSPSSISCSTSQTSFNGQCFPNTISCVVANGSATQAFANGAYGPCLVSSCNSGYTVASNACVATSQSCTVANGIGSQNFSNGSYSNCQATSCSSGYSLYNGSCKVTSQSCFTMLGSGSQTFASGSYGICQLSSCISGYSLFNGACYVSSQTCSSGGGTGTQAFANGSYGSCQINACGNGFTLVNGSCQATTQGCSIDNGVGSQSVLPNGSYGTCQATSCAVNYSLSNGSCLAASQSCTVANGTGSKVFANGSYGSCQATACNSEFSLYNGSCTASSQACTVANGSGTQSFANGSYGACRANACSSGFSLYNGSCYATSQSCAAANGNGTQTFANGSYGTCRANACSSGYVLSNGSCFASSQNCTLLGGTSGTQVFNGSGYDSCQASACSAGYTMLAGRCLQTCPAGASSSSYDYTTGKCTVESCSSGYALYNGTCVVSPQTCPIPNGTGSQNFSTSTGGYSACQATSCSLGYSLYNGTCTATSQACTVAGGVGAQAFNNGVYGSCRAVSCNSGFTLSNGACFANSQSCSSAAGSGTQSFSSGSYGSCQYSTCNTGYNLTNGKCLQPCSTGTLTANTDSLGYCLATSCQANYTLYNNSCVASSQTCTVINGTGSQSFTNGTYGTCQASTCNTGYALSNGSCVSLACSPANGTGGLKDFANGVFGTCRASACNSGYTLYNGICFANSQSCDVGSSNSPAGSAATGTQDYSNAGAYTTCRATSCNSGFTLFNNHCIASTLPCTGSYGTGIMTFSNGQYGNCQLNSCSTGYTLSNGACFANSQNCSLANGSGAQAFANGKYGSCVATSCNYGNTLYNGTCVSTTQTCTVSNGSGSQTFASGAYGACQVSTCNTGYGLLNGACVVSTRACSAANGTGTQMLFDGVFSACYADTCNAGYALYNGACYASSQSCTQSPNNPFGPPGSVASSAQSYVAGGLYGSCHAASCNSGYTLFINTCVASTISCSSIAGIGTQTFNNGTYANCQMSSCSAPYMLFNGACVDSTRNCTLPNGYGTQAFANGVYGACVATGCTGNTTLFNGTCVASSQTCTVANGSGYQTFSNGSFGACQVTSCDASFHVSQAQDACVYNVQGCTANGATSAMQTFTSGVFGDCTAITCSPGYTLSNGTCQLSAQPCDIANGSGVQSFANGSYGSCHATSCTGGYTAYNGACVVAAQSCALTNGTGTQVFFNGNYSSCSNATSCDAGFTPIDGACRSNTGYYNGLASYTPRPAVYAVGGINSTYPSCAILSDGTLQCFDYIVGTAVFNSDNSRIIANLPPVTAAGLGPVQSYEHGCVLTSAGGVKCMDPYAVGGAGPTFHDVAGLTSGVVMMNNGCAVLSSGIIRCINTGIGNAGPTTDISGFTEPVQAVAVDSQFVGDIYHENTICALLSSGAVKCLGGNEWGQLGNGSYENSFVQFNAAGTPTLVSGLSSGVVSIAMSLRVACALMSDTSVRCWGAGVPGAGVISRNGTLQASLTPLTIMGANLGVQSISMPTDDEVCAVTSSGTLLCAGTAFYPGNGMKNINTTWLAATTIIPSGVIAIQKGDSSNTACAVLNNGSVQCWGNNNVGQTGQLGSTAEALSPVTVAGFGPAISPVPIILPILSLTTSSYDGTLNLGFAGTAYLTVSVFNSGGTAAATVSANTGSTSLPLSLTVCQTNPLTGSCLPTSSPTASININLLSNTVSTFTVIATESSPIQLIPGTNRINVQITDTSGKVIGSTGVDVTGMK